VGGSLGYLAESPVYGYEVTAEGLAMATLTGAVAGAAFAAGGYTAGRLWSGFRGWLGARGAPQTVEEVLNNPNRLRTPSGRVRTPADVPDLIADAQSKGWTTTTHARGTHAGQSLRLLGPDGATIRYNPGTPRHFGSAPYWYVARGNPHLRAWVGPWTTYK